MIHLLLLLRLLTLRLLDHFMCYEYLLEEGSRFPFHLLSNVKGLQAVDADQHAVEVHHGRDLESGQDKALLCRHKLLPHVAEQDNWGREHELSFIISFNFVLAVA